MVVAQERWCLGTMLAGALLVVISINLPWLVDSDQQVPPNDFGLLSLFSFDGFVSGLGDLVSIVAIGVAAAAIAGIAARHHATGLPIGGLVVALCYLVVAERILVGWVGQEAYDALELDQGWGQYVAYAGAALCLAGVVALRGSSFSDGLPFRMVWSASGLMIAVATLLPWYAIEDDGESSSVVGLAYPAVAVAGVLALLAGAACRWTRRSVLAAAGGSALVLALVAGGLPLGIPDIDLLWGSWLTVVLATMVAGLAGIDLAFSRVWPRSRRLAAELAAGAVVLAGLALPLVRTCVPSETGELVDCYPLSALFYRTGIVATLALAAVIWTGHAVATGWLEVPALVVFGLVGAQLAVDAGSGQIDEGAYVALVGAVALVLLRATRLRPRKWRRPRMGAQLVPAGLALLAVVLGAVPGWKVLPQSEVVGAIFTSLLWQYGSLFGWSRIAIGVVLIALWLRRTPDRRRDAYLLWLLPSCLLVIAIEGLLSVPVEVSLRNGAGPELGLGLALLLLGVREARGGLRLRLPSVLRLDRIEVRPGE